MSRERFFLARNPMRNIEDAMTLPVRRLGLSALAITYA